MQWIINQGVIIEQGSMHKYVDKWAIIQKIEPVHMILDLQKVAFKSHTPQTSEPSVVHCQRDHEKGRGVLV